jgi:hypothetical protein
MFPYQGVVSYASCANKMFLLTCVLLMGITVTGLDRNLFENRGAALCHAVE